MSCSEQDTILLLQPQELARLAIVVGVEDLGDVLGVDLFLAGARVVAHVEGLQVEGGERLGLPQAQHVGRVDPAARVGRVVGDTLDYPIWQPAHAVAAGHVRVSLGATAQLDQEGNLGVGNLPRITQAHPADFVATHAYGVKEGYLDQNGTAGTILDASPDAVSGRMQHSRELLLKSALPKLELHFTEWSSAYTPTDYMHDQYHQASFILDKIKRAAPYVDSLSYWTFTDIFEENGPRFTPFHGGFGLINYQGIRKPSFYAYEYLSRLGTVDVVDPDAQSWITKSGDGQIQVLLWDYSPQVPPQGQNDQTYYKQDLPPQDKGPVHLALTHASNGKYRLQVYRIGYKVNDAYSDYLAMGAPAQLTPQQVRTLKEKNSGAAISESIVSVTDGRIETTVPLRTNDVYLLLLTKIVE